MVGLENTRWAAVLCAFFFFGFSDEAKENYRLLAYTVTRCFGSSTSTESAAVSETLVGLFLDHEGAPSFYPRLPVFRAACAQVAHISGAVGFFDESERAAEKSKDLAFDGSSFHPSSKLMFPIPSFCLAAPYDLCVCLMIYHPRSVVLNKPV